LTDRPDLECNVPGARVRIYPYSALTLKNREEGDIILNF